MVQQEYIRFLHLQEGVSIREISRRTGHHRNTIRRYIEGAQERYRRTAPVEYPVLGPYRAVIDRWLSEDRLRRPKERHTARRIYQRLRDEYGYEGGESTVRDYVRKQEKKLGQEDVYLPLRFAPGQSMQVDWGEASVMCDGKEAKVYMFCARLGYSTDMFVRVYPHARMEAFLDGFVRAFAHFGGVPKEVALDNLRTAVRAFVGRGEREETREFLALRTQYVFQAHFCTPGQRHEKGLVENLVGYARRNFFVPAPTVASMDGAGLEPLNETLRNRCLQNRERLRAHSSATVGALYEEERAQLLPLPERAYEAAVRRSVKVDRSALVRYENNMYSVPYRYAGMDAELKVFVDRLEVVAEGRVIASHPRRYGRHEYAVELDHYLEVLHRKPGALAYFRGWQECRLPVPYRKLLEAMVAEGRKVREFIDVLILRRDHPDPRRVDEAVATSLLRRCAHYEAIMQLVAYEPTPVGASDMAQVPERLKAFRVDAPDPSIYAQLAPMAGVSA